jgi:anti-sigma factor RsiW
MNCRDQKRAISLLVDRELDKESAEALRTHLAHCPECRLLYENVTALDADLRSVMGPSTMPALADRVKERIAAQRENRTPYGLIPQWANAALLTVAVVVAVALGNMAGDSVTDSVLTARSDRSNDLIELFLPEDGSSLVEIVSAVGGEEE